MLKPLLRQLFQEWADQREDWQPSIELLDDVWETILGAELADRTRPLRWSDDTTLHVAVPSDQWAKELRRYPRRFVGRLNELLPVRVERIEFHPRPKAFDEEASEPTQAEDAAVSRADPADADALDDDARAALDALDDDAREAALQILGHVEDDT
jgi:predicted nucleic acid-binding Zn ribbon protein